MIADLKELRIRLETQFEIADEEAEAGEATGTLAYALLSAIDLLKIIEERDGLFVLLRSPDPDARTLERTWQSTQPYSIILEGAWHCYGCSIMLRHNRAAQAYSSHSSGLGD